MAAMANGDRLVLPEIEAAWVGHPLLFAELNNPMRPEQVRDADKSVPLSWSGATRLVPMEHYTSLGDTSAGVNCTQRPDLPHGDLLPYGIEKLILAKGATSTCSEWM